jgi:hypothetical protein
MRQITVYRSEYALADAEKIGVIDDLPDETFECEPDEFDTAEGITAVDLALEVLNLKIYAEEASSYPDWQRSTWYSRTEDMSDLGQADRWREISAHLENFSDVEQLEIYKRFTNR